MNKNYLFSIIIMIVIFSSNLFAESYSIKGEVFDLKTGEKLSGASVLIINTFSGAYADAEGNFEIRKIAEGNYKLLVSMVGYESRKVDIKIPNNDNLKIGLNSQAILSGEIVVTANRRVQEVQDVPISISVVKSSEIIEQGSSSMKSVLAFVPGVEVNNDNVSIRGSSGFSFGVGSRALLMVDGIPMITADDGSVNYDVVPVFAVRQMEIIKGAGSALYGTGALGGVINILTNEDENNSGLHIRINGGIYTKPRFKQWEYSEIPHFSSSADIGYAKRFGDFSMLLALNALFDESWRLYDAQNRGSIFGKFAYNLSKRSKVSAIINYQKSNRDDWVYWSSLDSATRPPSETNLNQKIVSQKATFALNYNYIINEKNFLIVRTSIFDRGFELNLSPESKDYRNSTSLSYDNELQYNAIFTEKLSLTSGVTYLYNNVKSKNYGTHTQMIMSAYSQLEYIPFEKLIFTGGIRGDIEMPDNLKNTSSISPKLGISWKLNDNIALRASSGFGFRAPSVAERYASINFQGFTVVPNLDLKPEKSISYECGINYKILKSFIPIELDASFFVNNMNDLIEPIFSTDGSANIIFDNVSKVRIQGSEIGLRLLPAKWCGLETGFTYMDPRDLTTNEILKYRSQYIWYSKAMFEIGKFNFNIDYRYKSKIENYDTRLNLEIQNADAFITVHLVDLRLFYKWQYNKHNWKFGLICNNLMDYYYTEMVGNLGMTRRIMLQLETGL